MEKTITESIAEYTAAGYTKIKVLTPDELESLDSALKDFCDAYSFIQEQQGQHERIWKKGVAPLLRPGGCINTAKFLPRFMAYLEETMGTYVNAEGKTKNNFRMKLGTITDLQYAATQDEVLGWAVNGEIKQTKRSYEAHDFVLCPGEAVGTLNKLGLVEPAHARFVGASIKLQFPLSMLEETGVQSDYKMNMALRRGVTSSVSQAGIDDEGNFFIGVAGTKAFYGLMQPAIEDEYAIQANVYQLNVLNQIYPRILTSCLGIDTLLLTLTQEHLFQLVEKGYLKRGVGSRAVAYDGIPTVDHGYFKEPCKKVTNLFVNTHWGSGGVTNGPGAGWLLEEVRNRTTAGSSQTPHQLFSIFNDKALPAETMDAILNMTRSLRPEG